MSYLTFCDDIYLGGKCLGFPVSDLGYQTQSHAQLGVHLGSPFALKVWETRYFGLKQGGNPVFWFKSGGRQADVGLIPENFSLLYADFGLHPRDFSLFCRYFGLMSDILV